MKTDLYFDIYGLKKHSFFKKEFKHVQNLLVITSQTAKFMTLENSLT